MPRGLRITSLRDSMTRHGLDPDFYDAAHNRTSSSSFCGHGDPIRRAANPTPRAGSPCATGQPDRGQLRIAATETRCGSTQRVGVADRDGHDLTAGDNLRRAVLNLRIDHSAVDGDLAAGGRFRKHRRHSRIRAAQRGRSSAHIRNQHRRRVSWRVLN